MNKKMIRIAGWALGLSMAVAGIGIAVGMPQKAPVEVAATSTTTQSWSYSSDYNEVSSPSLTIGSVTAAFTKETGTNAPIGKAKTSKLVAAIRCYKDNKITFSCSTNITAITFTWGTTTAGGLSTGTGTYSAPNWTGSAKSIVFTVGNGQQHITGISVTYEIADSVSSITASAGSLTGSYKGSAYIQCSAKADGVATNDVTWTLSANTTYVPSQTSVTGASINSTGKVTFSDNVTVYAFATSTISTSVRGYIACVASGLVDAPTFNLITSTDSLYNDMTIVIGATNYSKILSTTQNSNNRGATAASQKGSDPIITTSNTDFQELTLSIEETSDGDIVYSFYTGSGYLYAASSSDNHLKTDADLDDNGRFKITISEGVATMEAQGSYTHKYLRFNSTLFSCYSAADSVSDASIFAATQTITAKQKVDTFVTKYMKMNSISTSYQGNAGTGYSACKTNWDKVYSAYNALGSTAQELFVGGGYANAVQRLSKWALANGKTLNTETGVMSAFVVNSFPAANEYNLPLVVTVAALGTAAVAGFFLFQRKRKEF